MNMPAMLRVRAALADAAEGRFPSGVERFSMRGSLNAACPIALYAAAYPDSAEGLELIEDLGLVLPAMGSLLGSEAIAKHLDISVKNAEHLFDPASYPYNSVPIKAVLARLDSFLERAEA